MIHENIELTGSFTVSGSFVLPNHSTTASLVEETGSMYHDSVDGVLKVYTGTQWVTVGEQTGPSVGTDIEYLVVAGGGGGGGWGGGGGAGGLLSSSLASVESGSSFTVTIGGGGAKGTDDYTAGGDGVDSSISGTGFSTVTAIGGGGGGYYNTNVGRSGGSGGGGGISNITSTVSGGSGTVGQGNDGGAGKGSGTNPYSGGGGGGGANGSGGDGQTSGFYYGGDGGDGKQSSITGTATYYAGGGGGHTDGRTVNAPSTSQGGLGGGGNGGRYGGSSGAANAENGTVNTGGGGGAAHGSTGTIGDGGSGVAILAYDSGSINAAGGIVGDAGNGRKYHQFNSSDTFKVGSTSDFNIVTDSLVAHYDAGNFSSRGSSTWTDLSGTSNGSVTNATLGQNFYYSFDGSGDYIDLGSIDTFSDGEYTMEAWCKVPAFSSPALMSIFTLQDDIYAYMFIYADGSFRLNTETSSGTANLYTSTGYDDGNWHHVVATYSPGLLSAYVDSIADGTNTSGTGNPNSNNGWSLVGGYDASKASLSQSYPLLGDVAQIRVYNKALSAAEVLQNYNATKTNFT